MFNICLYLYIALNGISVGDLTLIYIYMMQQYQHITLQKAGLSSCSLLLTKPYILGSVEFGAQGQQIYQPSQNGVGSCWSSLFSMWIDCCSINALQSETDPIVRPYEFTNRDVQIPVS